MTLPYRRYIKVAAAILVVSCAAHPGGEKAAVDAALAEYSRLVLRPAPHH